MPFCGAFHNYMQHNNSVATIKSPRIDHDELFRYHHRRHDHDRYFPCSSGHTISPILEDLLYIVFGTTNNFALVLHVLLCWLVQSSSNRKAARLFLEHIFVETALRND